MHLNVRFDSEKLRQLVMVDVRVDGIKELVAPAEGYRESAGAWADLLRECAPALAVGDEAPGFVKYKMGAKAKKGGTISRTRLGYLNVREMFEGREVRTVIVDKERAPLIVQGFEQYATGQYTAAEVLERITAAGLRTRGDRRTAPKPLSLNRFYDILSDRYYLGKIEYDGEEFEGRHPALISEDLYERVQRVLALHGGGGTRDRKHHHYLKGALWCGECGQRFIVMPGRGNGGTYFYFMCRGRQDHVCDQPYVRAERLEDEVLKHYATVRLSADFLATVRSQIQDVVLTELGSLDALRKRLSARLVELDAQETNYVRLVGKPSWPERKIQAELTRIAQERTNIEDQMAGATESLDVGREFYLTAMRLLRDPQEFYRRAGTSLKKALNKVIFAKIFVDRGKVAGHALTETAGPLVEASTMARTYYRREPGAVMDEPPTTDKQSSTPRNDTSLLLAEEAGWDSFTNADLLAATAKGHGSSRAVVVGDTGIEPVTSSVSKNDHEVMTLVDSGAGLSKSSVIVR